MFRADISLCVCGPVHVPIASSLGSSRVYNSIKWREQMRPYSKTALAVAVAAATATSALALDPVTDAIIANELPKCVNGVGVPGGCIGPNGEIIKAARNAINDLTKGPGDGNELFGKHGWVRRTFGW
jgi:hypothetical protein